MITDNNIQIVHTDNGAEFEGHFAKAVRQLNIPQVYSARASIDTPINT